MRVPLFACCVILGVSPLLWLPVLPSLSVIKAVIVALSLLAFICPKRGIRIVCILGLLFCWGVLAAWQVQLPALRIAGKNQSVEIVLSQTDGQTTHQGNIIRFNGQRLFPTPVITLYGNYLPLPPCAGQRWAMTIRARAVHGQLNDGGFDSQRYALAQHQPLTGRFIAARPLDLTCSLRAQFLASLQASLADYQWRDVLLALGPGERLHVDPEIKRLMQQTGTSHLMAISGLHIALGASLGWLLIRALQFSCPVDISTGDSRWLVHWFVAFCMPGSPGYSHQRCVRWWQEGSGHCCDFRPGDGAPGMSGCAASLLSYSLIR